MSTLRPSLPTESALRAVKKIIPRALFAALQPAYHRTLAFAGPLLYRFPSRRLVVIALTGTKGKSTTVELIRAMLIGAGYKTAALSTIRFCIGEECEPNLYKMTVPGRFTLQKFLRKAADAGCTHAVIEMTSEGARQFRHKGVDLDALVFTNLSPEHIESHGGLEQYAAAKLSLADHLAESPKRPRIIVANADDAWGQQFLDRGADVRAPFSLADAEPYSTDDTAVRFVWRGALFTVPLPGVFSLKNCLAALALGEALGLSSDTMKRALERIGPIAGRAERVERGQPFAVVVDYAHTPDSLRALYETYASTSSSTGKSKKIVCVLGSTGGGRDTWKRPAMGALADEYCTVAILANEDPYDENPENIVKEIAGGFSRQKPHIVLDRRGAIREALVHAERLARSGSSSVVLLTGKGTDPYIMGPHGGKESWSDKQVAEEELLKLGYH